MYSRITNNNIDEDHLYGPGIDSSTLLNKGDEEGGEIRVDGVLSSRHIQMIAIGGTIGSGLFIGSGSALASGGPGNLLLGFLTMGVGIYCTLQALGELTSVYPIKGSFSAYSTRFIHPAWGFAMTWNYVMQWWATLPLEISGAVITLTYWSNDINLAGFITLFLIFVVVLNMFFGVKAYGESEFYLSIIKVFAVVIFIIVGIVINLGGSPSHTYFGSKTWRHPGAFYNGFHGYCGQFVNAAFSFGGTELVGLAACETKEPFKTMPAATKQVVLRILLFYVVSLFVVGLIVPYTNPDLLGGESEVDTSPFVIAANLGGLSGFAGFMNAVILVSTLSVGNSSVFGASRTVLALVETKQLPAIFGYTYQGRPLVALGVSLIFGLVSYVSVDSERASTCFTWILAISGLSALFTWMSINIAHIRFRAAWEKAGHSLEELPFQAGFGVIGSWIGILINVGALIAAFYTSLFPAFGYPAPSDDDTTLSAYNFFSIYLAFPVIMVSFVGYLFYLRIFFGEKGWHIIELSEVDLVTGKADLPSLEELRRMREEKQLMPWYKYLWQLLF